MAYLNGTHAVEDILTESGRNWNQWFNELRSEKFQGLTCDEVEDFLVADYGIDRNWARRITNRFAANHEFQDEGDRKPCFEISVERTFDYPLESILYSTAQWFELENRAVEPSFVTKNELVCRWRTDHSTVAVRFETKEDGKTQMILQHDRIQSEIDAEIMRNFWEQSLKGMVEAF